MPKQKLSLGKPRECPLVGGKTSPFLLKSISTLSTLIKARSLQSLLFSLAVQQDFVYLHAHLVSSPLAAANFSGLDSRTITLFAAATTTVHSNCTDTFRPALSVSQSACNDNSSKAPSKSFNRFPDISSPPVGLVDASRAQLVDPPLKDCLGRAIAITASPNLSRNRPA